MQLLSLSSSQRVAARSILAILGAAMLVSACSRPAPPEEPVRSVKVITVGLGAFESGQEYAGEVRARVESRLGFRVAGKITKRTVEVGQRVMAGQLLAQLDPRDYQLAADAGRAQVVSATTQRDLAAADLTRYRALKDQNFISGAELERREATLKAAQATLEQAQAQLAGQGNQTGYTQLLADVSGVVTAVEAEAGQVVAAGTPVVRIAQDGPRDVVFAVPEDKLARVPVGSAVTVRSWTGGPSLRGTVRELAASADPVTRTFPVKVTLSEKDAGEALPLGATAYVVPQAVAQLAGGVIKLPTSALRQEGKGSAVWVLDTASMTVRSQPVQIATADGNEAVIASGLQPGQKVVSAGVHVLSPGQKVTIYKPNGPDPSAEQSSNAMKSGASAPAAPVAPTSASAPAASSSAPATR
ncbi:MAG: efflux RND transporter periplasmic adaptor subunit [Comamonadaceae bacterium]|uniref:efflux RND transporter periplasmic adaptor subunit n=1 Tax=Candidatus Skiveiella danica TaxID=3386177 RepID=UPI0039099203|nr:efflux RND transporter periplasmic adaptor subunit [Comamonadaceae bacterium]